MSTIVQPYLFFGGRCEEALAFYQSAIGAQQEMLMRYSDSPDPMPPGMIPPGYESKVMHASFKVGSSVIMASDGGAESEGFRAFSLSINVPTEADAERVFNALGDGGEVTMPLSKTFWTPRFGMLKDKFGMGWMITVEAKS